VIVARKSHLISPEEYVAGELESPVKHEYVGGVVYAMAGARNIHNQIAGNIFGRLHARLRGNPCQAYNSDTKVRIRLPTQQRFYYPDTMVVCRPNPPTDSFQDEPIVIVEVVSSQTRRIDEGEKKDAYLTIPSLEIYLLVEQDCPLAVAYRRTGEGFIREIYEGKTAIVPLTCIHTDLPLAEIYESVEFVPEGESGRD
jgi:Uma2 family endonuclease